MWILRRRGGLTAKKLAELCQCKATKEYISRRNHFIINYGRDYREADLNKNVIFNKLEVLNILKEANILVPRIFNKGDEIPEEAFPLLARRKYHSQGRDIIYIHNREQLENELEDNMYDYLVEYIPKKSEYRVHVLGDEIIANVKFNEDGLGDPIIRNHRNKYKMITYEGEHKENLEILARKVMDVLQYDFGAIDIIRRGNKLYVLEINSAPGLEDRKLNQYAEYFKKEEEKWKKNLR